MTDKNAIAQIIALISAAYPSFSPTEETVEAYWQMLGDIPETELKAATLACVPEAGRKFAPSVGEIRGKVSELRTLQQGIPTSYEAWQEVQKAPKLGFLILGDEQRPDGSWVVHVRDFKWSHPLVECAAHLMGWPDFPGPPESIPSDRARFIECYEQLVEQASKADMLLPEVKRYLEEKRSLPDETPKPLQGFLEAKVAQPKERRKKASSNEGRGFSSKRPGPA